MTVYVVVREDQNQHGFVDTSIEGVYLRRSSAEAQLDEASRAAAGEGLRVERAGERDWDVCWRIEEHPVE